MGKDVSISTDKGGSSNMKIELGNCLLHVRLAEAGITQEELAHTLRYKPERQADFIENRRIMPLKTAISISETIGCGVKELYELIAVEMR